MSQLSSGRRGGGPGGIYVEKPKSDIYTALLVVALLALLTGIVLLVLHLNKYDFEFGPSAGGGTAAVQSPEAAPAPVFALTESGRRPFPAPRVLRA